MNRELYLSIYLSFDSMYIFDLDDQKVYKHCWYSTGQNKWLAPAKVQYVQETILHVRASGNPGLDTWGLHTKE